MSPDSCSTTEMATSGRVCLGPIQLVQVTGSRARRRSALEAMGVRRGLVTVSPVRVDSPNLSTDERQ